VAYNDTMSRNLGFSGPEAITAGLDWNFGYNLTRNRDRSSNRSKNGGYNFVPEQPAEKAPTTGATTKEKVDAHYEMIDGLTTTRGRDKTWNQDMSSTADFSLSGVQATINLLKRNGAAKTLYSTTLSTQSGIEAQFQNGGTIHRSTTPGMGSSGDMVSIEYGYIIKATPLIVDANTVNLDFDLDNKQPISRDTADIEISRYQTKSKYLMRPGESIMLSGYKYNTTSQSKKGTPWLSNIPWIGPYLFGNTSDEVEMNEMLLVVTVNWALEDEGEDTSALLNEMKDRKVEVEMP
jgi:type II secretory pathway component GspD/PulD (secretin)